MFHKTFIPCLISTRKKMTGEKSPSSESHGIKKCFFQQDCHRNVEKVTRVP